MCCNYNKSFNSTFFADNFYGTIIILKITQLKIIYGAFLHQKIFLIFWFLTGKIIIIILNQRCKLSFFH